jgi:hypothetical protein
VLYLGYDFQILGSSMVLDEELVLMPNQNNSRIQKLLPWKEGDKFEIVVSHGNTMFKQIKE